MSSFNDFCKATVHTTEKLLLHRMKEASDKISLQCQQNKTSFDDVKDLPFLRSHSGTQWMTPNSGKQNLD